MARSKLAHEHTPSFVWLMLYSGHSWFQHTEYHVDVTAVEKHKAQKHRKSKKREHKEVLQWSDVVPSPGSAAWPRDCLGILALKNSQIKYRSGIGAGLFLGQAACYEAVSYTPSCFLSSPFWPSQSWFSCCTVVQLQQKSSE